MMDLLFNGEVPFPVGLKGVKIVAVKKGHSSLSIRVQKDLPFGLCPHCGTLSQKVNDRHLHKVTDRPLGISGVNLEVLKRRWKCLNSFCEAKTFTEQVEGLRKKRTHTDLFGHHVYQLSRQMTFTGVYRYLQEVHGCQTALATVYRVAVEELHHQVPLPQKVTTPFVGLDEFSKGKGHDYGVVLVDLVRRKVIDVDGSGKTKKAARGLLVKLDGQALRACAIDMWEPFKAACQEVVPQAQVVVDRFHVIKAVNEAVDTVRKRVRQRLRSQEKKRALFRFKDLLLMGLEKVSPRQEPQLWEVLSWDEGLSHAYELKEILRAIYAGENGQTAATELDQWIREAIDSGIEEMDQVAKSLIRWKPEVLNYWGYRIDNAITEGKINKIKTLRRRAYNYNNFQHLRLKILEQE